MVFLIKIRDSQTGSIVYEYRLLSFFLLAINGLIEMVKLRRSLLKVPNIFKIFIIQIIAIHFIVFNISNT